MLGGHKDTALVFRGDRLADLFFLATLEHAGNPKQKNEEQQSEKQRSESRHGGEEGPQPDREAELGEQGLAPVCQLPRSEESLPVPEGRNRADGSDAECVFF